MWATRAESPVRLERAAREGQDGAHVAARQAQDLSALVTTALAAAAVLAQRTERAAGSLQQTAGAEQQIAETMKEIVASVQRVMEIVGGITTSVAEQSEGLSRVNAAAAELIHLWLHQLIVSPRPSVRTAPKQPLPLTM